MKPTTTMLAVEVEFLTGVARAANDRGDAPDWPPQPDRLFSALVATWAARGMREDERAALEWLERAETPMIDAGSTAWRTMPKVYVPPNDDAGTVITVLPEHRRRQERRFAACVPHDPVVRWLWSEEPDGSVFDGLDALARDTSYLGHSSSLVRCTVRRVTRGGIGVAARRTTYAGRLAELERAFKDHRRPAPGASLAPAAVASPAAPSSVFGADWIVFAHAGGWRPDAVGAALWAKTMLKTVQSGYHPFAAPAWVSGHSPEGAPLATPHLAALPLLDAGWAWSQGRLMGIALSIPHMLEDAADEETGLFQALARVNEGGPDGLELELRLPGGKAWRVRREAVPEAQSLRPGRYAGASRVWASVTPIALDRHPKAVGDAEASIAVACERIGLPLPLRVVAGKHAAIRGAPSARPGARAPDWTGWRLPPPLTGRRLTHAVVEFEVPVCGPVLLGAGRFVGLGLCLPLQEAPE
jgi:CRISPR-associated protein Csb2